MILEQISEMLQKGKAPVVKELVQQAIDMHLNAQEILNDGLIRGMSIIGEKFKRNEVFVPEVLIAARAMNQGLGVLRPLLVASGTKPIGKALICTVKGDLHDIGKNLVKMMIEGKGVEVIDLGVDCSPEKLVDAIESEMPEVVCLSALLSTTMINQKMMIDVINERDKPSKVKVNCGGAPVTKAYADEIGADGYASDAASAADLVVKLINEKHHIS